MPSLYDTVIQLTSEPLSVESKARALNDFAYKLGWRPSDKLEDKSVDDFSSAHLIVEHGLENSAVISFIKSPFAFSNLGVDRQQRLFSLSYNNLVDWHIGVENDRVTYIYNRSNPPRVVNEQRIGRENLESLRSQAFDQIAGRKPNPNFPALDDALIRTVSYWKRNLSAELNNTIPIESFSSLFNLIIFTRAAEDHQKRIGRDDGVKSLLKTWNEADDNNRTIGHILTTCLRNHIEGEIPDFIVDIGKLNHFSEVDESVVYSLLSDFYVNKYAKYYEYDFSLMSKHALSKIYEKYVSILRKADSAQGTLFPELPEEEKEKAFGSVYTPQYIARFFARYVEEQMPPMRFRKLKSIDPACGSGIFLRTLLERQCDPVSNKVTTEDINLAFENAHGIDIDENATQATRLSLSLLYLVLTNSLPEHLNIHTEEAISLLQNDDQLQESFDIVTTNPPFVPITAQSEPVRELMSDFMGGKASGRIDTYLAFLHASVQLLKPGGYGLLVLPHSFLLSENARGMRKEIAKSCDVKFIADLSEVNVFDEYNIYTILLVLQKHGGSPSLLEEPATVVECDELVGLALQDAMEGKKEENAYYKIYDVDQEFFREDGSWILLPPVEASIEKKFGQMNTLENFMEVRQGFVSGANDIFIINSEIRGDLEQDLFVPYLQDKEMQAYTTPQEVDQYFFYPYIDGDLLSEEDIRSEYSLTWNYLDSNRAQLESRSQVRKGNLDWWRPSRPRPPERMMRPKIISPHLVVLPRFSLDKSGRFAVCRSPILYPKEDRAEDDILKFFLAVLNSSTCYWYISNHSHKYRGGYAMLEQKTLRKTPVPDPFRIMNEKPDVMMKIIKLVEHRISNSGDNPLKYEEEIDYLVSEMYGLTQDEKAKIGIA